MRERQPDHKKAQSLISAAERDLAYTLRLSLEPAGFATIFRNIYESFRKLGEAYLLLQGLEPENHQEAISVLASLPLALERSLGVLEMLRRTRNKINYYGYEPPRREVDDALSLARCCFQPVCDYLRELIK